MAASGGRMGGNSFKSRSSYSSSKPKKTSSLSSSCYSEPKTTSSSSNRRDPGVVLLILVMFVFSVTLNLDERPSVLMLQVGTLGMGRSLQRDLNRIAETADTSTPDGLRYVLAETTLALIRHLDDCISAYSSVVSKQSMEDVEKHFNELSFVERGKFDEETLVNVNNIKIKKQSATSQTASGISNEYIVTTILVAAEGVHKLPTINGIGDLKEALQKLGPIPSSKIKAVEVLWTPQDENDTLSAQKLLQDYPLLRPL